jgi:tRNA pseudouridine55 synthase
MDGLLIIDKPAGCTSHDVVIKIRKLLGQKRVGHGGTLDPDATGVLVLALGQATRFFRFLGGHDKTYEGTIRLGFATDTYDASGRPDPQNEPGALPPAQAVAAAMEGFEGEILQVPPRYSAKKVGGRPAYRLARARKDFVLEPALVKIRFFKLKNYAPPFVEFEVKCSPGTYVRSLAHDLGRKLGTGGHLQSLRRTSSGPFGLKNAVSLSEVEKAVAEGRLPQLVIPLEGLLTDAPAVVLPPAAGERIRNGSPLLAAHLAGFSPGAGPDGIEPPFFRILDSSGKLLGLARPSAGHDALLPFLIVR